MATDSEEVKRSQRVLQDLSKRLDDLLSRATQVSDLFVPEANLYRVRMRDHSSRLVNADPVRWGTSAIDLYWRKSVYHTLAAARNTKRERGWTPMEKAYVVSHLVNAVGHYQHFLWYLLEDFGWSKRVLDKLGVRDITFDMASSQEEFGFSKMTEKKPRSLNYDSETQSNWLRDSLHSCLMHLGDLYRYLSEFQPGNVAIAKRFYHEAIVLDVSRGLPFNQLATLAGTDLNGLSAAFYYLKCVTSPKPFESAEANLKRLLDKNSKEFARYVRVKVDGQDSGMEVLSAKQETERCIVYLLQMINVFLYGEASGSQLSKLCQQALQCVQHCLYLPTEDESAVLLPEDVALQMVLSLVLVTERLKKKASALSMLRAYLLALFSHLVTKFLGDLHVGLFGPESLVELFEEKPKEVEKNEDQKMDANREIEEVKPASNEGTKSKKKKKKVSKLDKLKRRRRGRGSLEDEEDSSSDGSIDEDCSNTDDSASNSDSETSNEDDDTDSSEDDIYQNGILHSDSDDDDEYLSEDDDDVIVESSKDILSTLNLVKLVGRHQLLQAIRACGLWLENCPEVVAEATDPTSSGVLWTRLAKLFTLLSLKNPIYDPHEEVDEAMALLNNDKKSLIFPEDFLMRGMPSLGDQQISKAHQITKWNGITPEPSGDEGEINEGVRRIATMYQLRDWICESLDTKLVLENDGSVILSDKEKKKPEKIEEQNGSKSNSQEDEDEAKKKMMRNMAHLWLQQEVHELECDSALRSVGAAGGRGTLFGFAHYSPYIVLDHLALSLHLHLVKEIVASRKFAVIVPAVVIHMLDEMKKDNAGARMAIRWLERQFRDGNRWLRPQRKEESRPLELLQYPKKKDREAWQYFKILECCNHFAGVREQDSATEKQQVSLLTAEKEPSKDSKDEKKVDQDKTEDDANSKATFDPKGLGGAVGIRVEKIDNFISQTNTGKNGKRNKGRQFNNGRKGNMKQDGKKNNLDGKG